MCRLLLTVAGYGTALLGFVGRYEPVRAACMARVREVCVTPACGVIGLAISVLRTTLWRLNRANSGSLTFRL